MGSNSKKKRATLADVAAVAGVSKMTVSRALRGAADVSGANIEKVRRAAREIGYVGNPLASSLSGQRAPLVGVVVPGLENIVFAEVVTGIAETLDGTGIQPFFGVTNYRQDKEFDVVQAMLAWNPVGLIVTGLDQSDETRHLLQNSDLPIVQIMDLDGSPIDCCVGFSQAQAGADIARALIENGFSKFGFVGSGLDQDTRAAKRLAGFETTLKEHNLHLLAKQIDTGLTSSTKGRLLTETLLEHHPNLDCIYFSNDDMAIGGAFHCISAGIKVGCELTLVGFNGLDILNDLPIPICTTVTPRNEIGQAAVEMLLDRDKQGQKAEPTTRQFLPTIKLNARSKAS